MILKKVLFFVAVIFFLGNSQAQEAYYIMNGQEAVSEEDFQKTLDLLNSENTMEEYELKTEIKNDSILHHIIIQKKITMPDGFDPWGEQKKLVGTKFPIESFSMNHIRNFPTDYLEGKPTVINFWFTTCGPCIVEMPVLNQLKEEYGESVNFISITFNKAEEVDEFLKTRKFDYFHITDSMKQIQQLKIFGFPTNFVLDKEGVLKWVTGDINVHSLPSVKLIIDTLL